MVESSVLVVVVLSDGSIVGDNLSVESRVLVGEIVVVDESRVVGDNLSPTFG